ncbi:SDR family oxidoreductase [Cellulosimicrobium cellulans]|uniref:SDR family oxidoreductase n=1 Tax=Cellulosimicrobium cellulans TaxID=1710 RepID=UPI0030182FCB
MTLVKEASVLVTGANGGLGQQFVLQALERGAARVYAAARRTRDWDDERVVPLEMDVTDARSVDSAADAAPDVSILVNNAGILRRGSLLTAPMQDVREQMETNFFGALQVTRSFAPAVIAHGGAIVNIASVLSWVAFGHGYSVSKAALWSATNALRLELAPTGVQVLGAYLATTDTPMNRNAGVPSENDPADVVRAVLDGLERGDDEVLADDTTRRVRAALSSPARVLHQSVRTP